MTNELRHIALEADFNTIEPIDNIRKELDIDSIDWLNFLVSVGEPLGISIPEADFDQLDTLQHVLDYVMRQKVS